MSTSSLRLVKLDNYSSSLLDAEELEVIPQISGTCWFNSILMVFLYSEGVRKVVYEKVSEWFLDKEKIDEIKKSKFLKFLIYMLKYNYSQPSKISNLFNKRVSSEFLLFSYLNEFDKYNFYKEQLKNKLNKNLYDFSGDHLYIINFLINLQIKSLLIYYDGNKIYQTKIKIKNNKSQPKLLLLYHKKLFKSLDSVIEDIKSDSTTTIIDENNQSIVNYEEVIIHEGNTYKLEACLLADYNNAQSLHSITGITYKNKSFVYNGWVPSTKLFKQQSTYYKELNRSSCKLFHKDWKNDLRKFDGSEGFCFNQKDCGLIAIDDEYLCFDFSNPNNDNTVLIYVLQEEFPLLSLKSIPSSEIRYKSESLSIIHKSYYNLKRKTTEELIKLLSGFYYTIEELEFNDDYLRMNYKLFYFLLFKKRIEDENDETNLTNNFLIRLIKDYLKDYKLYDLSELIDEKIKYHLSIQKLKKRLIKIGYDNSFISFLNENTINDYYLLFKFLLPKKEDEFLLSFLFELLRIFVENNITHFSIINEKFNDENLIKSLAEFDEKTLKEKLKNTLFSLQLTNKELNDKNSKIRAYYDKIFINEPTILSLKILQFVPDDKIKQLLIRNLLTFKLAETITSYEFEIRKGGKKIKIFSIKVR